MAKAIPLFWQGRKDSPACVAVELRQQLAWRGLTVHRTVIQYPRAATLRIYIRREEGNGGRKRPLKFKKSV